MRDFIDQGSETLGRSAFQRVVIMKNISNTALIPPGGDGDASGRGAASCQLAANRRAPARMRGLPVQCRQVFGRGTAQQFLQRETLRLGRNRHNRGAALFADADGGHLNFLIDTRLHNSSTMFVPRCAERGIDSDFPIRPLSTPA